MKKKSNLIIYFLIALVLIIVMASLITNALARYATQYTGKATVNAAAWSFKEGDLTETVALTSTATNLATGKIAPGTSGSFPIDLDASGTETGVKYTITLDKPSGTPAGLKLTVDSQEVTSITGYIPYSSTEGAMKKTVTVNWEWELGNDSTNEVGIDNTYAGNNFEIGVTVRGEQHTGSME